MKRKNLAKANELCKILDRIEEMKRGDFRAFDYLYKDLSPNQKGMVTKLLNKFQISFEKQIHFL